MAIRLTREGVRKPIEQAVEQFLLFQVPATTSLLRSHLLAPLLFARLFLCYPRLSSTFVPLVFARRRPYLLLFSLPPASPG